MKTFFKQFWNLVKQNKLFTGIYVIGSGIAIAMTMAIFIVLYMKFAPIYPEYNRNRTLVMKYIGRTGKVKDVGRWGGALSYQLAEKLRTLTHVDKVASMSKLSSKEYYSLLIPQTNTNLGVVSIFTDTDYWKVFQFHFISGRPFTETEVTSNLPVVILSEHTAMRVFASTDVVDKLIVINGNEYKVCGVVKEVSTTQPTTSAEIYLPLFNFPPNKQANNRRYHKYNQFLRKSIECTSYNLSKIFRNLKSV